jgi:glycosyltransferase involved in cell wall biosynthesis
VEVFKKFYKKGFADWKLVLAGGVEVGVGDYIKKLERMTKGYPIEIIKSPKHSYLMDLYGRSKIFWSAVGEGINEVKEPSKVEHFGITVVEAMAGGTIPIVYNAGGYKEIIVDGKNGFLWEKRSELVKKTITALEVKSKMKLMSQEAVRDSKFYEYERFAAQVEEIIK